MADSHSQQRERPNDAMPESASRPMPNAQCSHQPCNTLQYKYETHSECDIPTLTHRVHPPTCTCYLLRGSLIHRLGLFLWHVPAHSARVVVPNVRVVPMATWFTGSEISKQASPLHKRQELCGIVWKHIHYTLYYYTIILLILHNLTNSFGAWACVPRTTNIAQLGK